eukprot:gene17013-biopygen15868
MGGTTRREPVAVVAAVNLLDVGFAAAAQLYTAARVCRVRLAGSTGYVARGMETPPRSASSFLPAAPCATPAATAVRGGGGGGVHHRTRHCHRTSLAGGGGGDARLRRDDRRGRHARRRRAPVAPAAAVRGSPPPPSPSLALTSRRPWRGGGLISGGLWRDRSPIFPKGGAGTGRARHEGLKA